STLCKRLDEEIKSFKEQPLNGFDAPFVMVDATYFKARENHKIVSKAFMVALAFKSDGHREIIGFEVFDSEDNYSWYSFLNNLKERGLKAPKVIVSDSHKSIRKAIAEVFPSTAWQRCQVHLMRNILDKTPLKYKEGLKVELREMFNASTCEEARKIKNRIIADYEEVAEKAMQILETGFEDSMTMMNLPEYIRIKLRTTNYLERLNREFKRRSDVIQVFPNEASIMRLMGAVAIEYNDKGITASRVYSESRYIGMQEQITVEYKEIALKQLADLQAA
ncbi:MAG: IS256 family transposase, partial [Eubacteriales bacterium]|nr:IS256 family transposase [Eubacteriales bacterium]